MKQNEQIVLAVETAGRKPSLSLLKKSLEIGFWQGEEKVSNAESLVPALENLLQQNGVKLNDISILAVSIGPGSFNGLRVGIATAKALCLGTRIRQIGINTLEALAFAAGETGRIRSIIGGGRHEYFVQDFYFETLFSARQITQPSLIKPEEVLPASSTNSFKTITSEQNVKDSLSLQNPLSEILVLQENLAKYVGLLALEKKLDLQNQGCELQPLYIREANYKRLNS